MSRDAGLASQQVSELASQRTRICELRADGGLTAPETPPGGSTFGEALCFQVPAFFVQGLWVVSATKESRCPETLGERVSESAS